MRGKQRPPFPERLHALLDASRQISASPDLGRMAGRVIRTARALVEADRVSILTADAARGVLRLAHSEGMSGPAGGLEFPLEQDAGVTVHAARSGVTAYIPDVLRDPRYIAGDPGVRCEIALPLCGGGELHGVLDLQSIEVDAWDAEDRLLLEGLAECSGSSFHHLRIRLELEDERERLRSLIASSPDAIVTTDVRGVVTFFSPGAEDIYGFRADEVVGKPVSDFYVGGVREARQLMELMERHGKVVNHELVIRARAGKLVQSNLSASLLPGRVGGTSGTIGILKDITRQKDLEARLERTIDMLREANESLERLATTDSLSGLANHRVFYRRLEEERERCNRTGRPLSLLLLDIDRFKAFNDTYGHLVGDQVIEEIGRVIRGTIRKMDCGCRYGGEEFTVILPETGGDSARVASERICEGFRSSPLFERLGIPPATISVGVTEYAPDSERPSVAELVRNADAAMYAAKKHGGNRIVIHGEPVSDPGPPRTPPEEGAAPDRIPPGTFLGNPS